MKATIWFAAALGLVVAAARGQDVLDRVDDALTWSSPDAQFRGRVSGTLDLEAYAFPQPVPGVIDAEGHSLFSPRLAVFLDAQMGDSAYFFGQWRVDRGFDPAPNALRLRFDEYALRWTVSRDRRVQLQVGKFATVVGNWTTRHGSWSNPFITAPLPYENLTGIWDTEPPRSAGQLLVWSHLRPGLSPAVAEQEKYLRVPIIWGPSYATGFAIAGETDRFRYALGFKNASLASRPALWSPEEMRWDHPTVSGRVRYVPDEQWEFGWSASSGVFLRPSATALLPAGYGRGAYRETLIGDDIAFAWHHFQVWAEIYAVRFEIPLVGHADTLAYYVESRYKFAPRFSGAVRWNEQLFGTVEDHGVPLRWGRNVWRVDVAPEFRLTSHAQLKLQYSLQHGTNVDQTIVHLVALQSTLRF